MNPKTSKLLPLAAALLMAAGTALPQQPPPATGAAPAPTAAAAAPAAGEKTFSQQDLDQMLAPIALYPDALLAQILMASTYPLAIVEAARWSKANPKVAGKELEDAMQKQEWDPSVKALTSVPTVLKQLNENITLTQKLGDAFLAQQEDVMKTVQALRTKAKDSGNLKSTPEQMVKTEVQEGKTVDHHRVGQDRDDLRADLQPGHGVRHLVVSVSALLDVPAGLRLRAGTRVRDRHCGRRRHLGELQLGRQQREREREQLQQLQQDQHQQLQLPAQRR